MNETLSNFFVDFRELESLEIICLLGWVGFLFFKRAMISPCEFLVGLWETRTI